MDRQQIIDGMRASQQRLVSHVQAVAARGSFDDTAAREPSLLPGWSRGHVLTHLARNADSVTRALEGAARGEVAERYPGPPGSRDREIEHGAARLAAVLVDDFARSAHRLDEAIGTMTSDAWSGVWRTAAGGHESVAELPWLRWREVSLHHLDLDLPGFGIDDLDPAFVAAEALSLGLTDSADGSDPAHLVARRNGRPGRDAAAWTAATLDPSWCRPLSGLELEAIAEGLDRYRAAMGPGLALTPDSGHHFMHDGLQPLVDALRTRLIDGDGVQALEGFGVTDHTDSELRAIWWGLCSALGTHRAQSHRGDLIGDVRDLGTGISGRAGRGYTSNSELNFHADACDVSGLFFLRTAKAGGVTRIASSVTTHDRLAAEHPGLLDELYRPLPWSWQGNQPDGEPGWYAMPVFGRIAGRTSCAYVRTNLLLAAENGDAPSLDERQIAAVEAVRVTASAEGMWVERLFEPGTMLFVHNHTVLHLRTAFEDWDEPARKRHLLRSWLSLPNNRRLPASFASFFDSTEAGAVRGGYHSRSGTYRFDTGSAVST